MSLGAKKLVSSKPSGPAKGVLAKAVLAKSAAKPANGPAKTAAKATAKPAIAAVAGKAKPTAKPVAMNASAKSSSLSASAKPTPVRAALINKPGKNVIMAPRLVAAPKIVEPVAIDPRWQPFQELLLAKKAELTGTLSDTRFGAHANGRVAEEDQASVSHEEFISSKRNAMDFKMLRLVQAALDRIGHGEYGICHACEEDISEKRLKVIPWAEYCVRCQDNHAHSDDDPAEAGVGGGPAPALQVWNW